MSMFSRLMRHTTWLAGQHVAARGLTLWISIHPTSRTTPPTWRLLPSLMAQDKAHLVERRARQEDACLMRARSRDLAEAPCQYSRARWLLIGILLVATCVMLLGTLGVAPFAAPLRSVGRHFNHASTGEPCTKCLLISVRRLGSLNSCTTGGHLAITAKAYAGHMTVQACQLDACRLDIDSSCSGKRTAARMINQSRVHSSQ